MKQIKEVIHKYLAWAPVSLTVREVTRIHSIRQLDEKFNILNAKSILDVGCGDGRWWLNILDGSLDRVHGIDISSKEIALAKELIWAKCLDVTSDDFKKSVENKTFDLVIGNCSMEHIFQIDRALKNIHEVLEDNGMFILFVPTPYWAFKGKSVGILNSISPRLSMMFSGMINGFFQHWHLYNYRIWISILTNFKFRNIEAYGLGNKNTEFLFRLFLPSAFISYICKQFTGKYLNFFFKFIIPTFVFEKISMALEKRLDSKLRQPNEDDIFEYILVCKK